MKEIEEILEKYHFKKAQEEGIKKIFKAETPEEREEIFENLPGSKLSEIVDQYLGGEISKENLALILKQSLSLEPEQAQAIAKDLKEKVLDLIEAPSVKKEKPVSEEKPEIEAEKEEKPEKPEKEDLYQEPIE